METIKVNTAPAYNVLVGRGLLSEAGHHLRDFVEGRQVVIISDENVERNGYVEILSDELHGLVTNLHKIILPPGEETKSMGNYGKIQEKLVELGITRTDYIIALGGGVIGDLAGFVAATYLRGIAYIQIPTTFLSAIDSSVGGKTAIDLAAGKNLVGAFYQPKLVLCDPDTFLTLERHIFEDGCSEMIKYGMIMSPWLLDKLNDIEGVLTAKSPELVEITAHCIGLKRDVVEADEKESHQRQLLNFGHTIGHAIEQCSNYQISHGRGVAHGMDIIMQMAEKKAIVTEEDVKKLQDILNEYNLLNANLSMTADEIIKACFSDKKRRGDEITLVVPTGEYGRCELTVVGMNELEAALEKVW